MVTSCSDHHYTFTSCVLTSQASSKRGKLVCLCILVFDLRVYICLKAESSHRSKLAWSPVPLDHFYVRPTEYGHGLMARTETDNSPFSRRCPENSHFALTGILRNQPITNALGQANNNICFTSSEGKNR